MSMIKRLAQGNIAALLTMGFNIVAQISVVPIFLHHWDLETYGTWLAIITTLSLVTMFDITHQDYLGFESMKFKAIDREGRSRLLSDALPVIVITGAVQTLLLYLLLHSPYIHAFLQDGRSGSAAFQASNSLLLLFSLWCFYQNFSGILVRVLTSLGYFAVGAWWGLVTTIGTTLGPAFTVMCGGGFMAAVLTQILVVLLINTAIYAHYAKLLRANGIKLVTPDVKRGLHRYATSLGLGVANLAEFMQQAGFRLVVLPLIGAQRLVQFSTHRTVANVAQQGVATLINPALPELIQLIENRDATKVGVLMTSLFYITVVIMCPALVVLQTFIPWLFEKWTAGKISYDPLVFVTLSAAVLLYCLSQPSRAIIRGSNLIRAQLLTSVLTGVVILGLVILLVPHLQVMGAALSLLFVEVLRLIVNLRISSRLFAKKDISYPWISFLISLSLVLVSCVTMLFVSSDMTPKIIILAAYGLIWLIVNAAFWFYMPTTVRDIAKSKFASMQISAMRSRQER